MKHVQDQEPAQGTYQDQLAMGRQNNAADGPLALLPQSFRHDAVGMPSRTAVGKQVEAAAGKENRINLMVRKEVLQDERLVLGRPDFIQFIGFDDDIPIAGVLIAADDIGGLDRAMHRTAFLVLDAPATVGMELIELDGG